MEQTLGGYELRSERGRGSAATVYEAFDPRLERRIALKVVRLSGETDWMQNHMHARFRQEARITAALNHPGIVAAYGYDETPEFAFLAMEFIDGETLKERLDRDGPPPLAQGVALMVEMLRILDYCHRNGVVHRDLKPSNMMLPKSGGIKLADFGIARPEDSKMDTLVGTRMGTWIGTPPYMSPEQFTARDPVTARSDIWSCGIVIYEVLTGKRPFRGDENAIAYAVVNEPAPPPSSMQPHIPVAIDAVLARALAKKPDARFPDAAAFADALQAALLAPAPAPMPTAQPAASRAHEAAAPRRHSRLLIGMLIATILLAGGASGAYWWRQNAAQPPPAQPQTPQQDTIQQAAARRQQAETEQQRQQAAIDQSRQLAETEQQRQQTETEQRRQAADAKAAAEKRQLDAAEETRLAKEAKAREDRVVEQRRLCHDWRKAEGAILNCAMALLIDTTPPAERIHLLLSRGLAHDHLGQFDRAIQDFTEVLEQEPHHPAALLARGYAGLSHGQYDRAIQDFGQILQQTPSNTEARSGRGAAYFLKGQYQPAIQDFDQVIAINPNHPDAFVYRGTAYSQLGQHARAIQDLDQAIKQNPNAADALNSRGMAYRALGQAARAAEDFAKARKINPNLPPPPQ